LLECREHTDTRLKAFKNLRVLDHKQQGVLACLRVSLLEITVNWATDFRFPDELGLVFGCGRRSVLINNIEIALDVRVVPLRQGQKGQISAS
jgi:hypothetical protein